MKIFPGGSQFVLASASPQRAQLLRAANYRFSIDPADIDETVLDDEDAAYLVARLARAKALHVAKRSTGQIVLSGDTIVTCLGQLFGKAGNRADAIAMISFLNGRSHEVVSGVAVVAKEVRVKTVRSVVRLREMTRDEVEDYAATELWRGKAGSYGVQDENSIVDSVDGCLSNVIGLPMTTARQLLAEVGIFPT